MYESRDVIQIVETRSVIKINNICECSILPTYMPFYTILLIYKICQVFLFTKKEKQVGDSTCFFVLCCADLIQ